MQEDRTFMACPMVRRMDPCMSSVRGYANFFELFARQGWDAAATF